MNHTVKAPLKRQSGAVSGPVGLTIIVVIALLIAVYFLFIRSSSEQVTPGSVPPTTSEERGDAAREVIAELKEEKTPKDLATAYEQAKEHRAAGRLADAQLLYFFAARSGHTPAAFDLATMYDPAYFNSDTSVMNKPDPFQAYKWYKQARDGGQAQAEARIDALKDWATQAARDGDANADRLMMLIGTK